VEATTNPTTRLDLITTSSQVRVRSAIGSVSDAALARVGKNRATN
jgi:hypothetical protein